MTISRRNLRYIRYRVFGCIQGSFTYSNVVFVAFVMVMGCLIFFLQKLEDPYTVNISSIVPFLPTNKRREIIITTARFIPITKKPTKCEKLEAEMVKMEHFVHNVKSRRNSTNLKIGKNAIRYQPAIRLFPNSKSKKGSLKSNDSVVLKKHIVFPDERKTKNEFDQSPPDIYRSKFGFDELTKGVHGINQATVVENDKWVSINQEKDKVLVFSAYWDDRMGHQNVRILAIMITKKSPTIYCRIQSIQGKCYDVIAVKKTMNEHWRLKYASYLLSCPLSKDHPPPTHVEVSTYADFVESATLRIHHNKNDSKAPRGYMAVCVKPFHYEYDRATWLLEFLELHRMLGVDYFYFYNHTVGPNVEKVLRSYMDMNVVSVLPWKIGIMSQKEIRTEAIFSALNDCLFRTMFLFNYVIMLDFDEYIIPRDHDTYSDMLEKLEKDNKKMRGQAGSFVFRNTFFYLYWPNDTTVFGAEPEKSPSFIPYFVTQYKTRRLVGSMKPGSRSKYIVIPHRAVEVGNHVVWKHTPGSRSINVPDRIALLHHYRICEFGGFACLKKTSAVDQTALRFGPELLHRVRYQCEIAFKPAKDCPISPPLGSPW